MPKTQRTPRTAKTQRTLRLPSLKSLSLSSSFLSFLSLALACSRGRASGPLPQEAYVWQRAWTPAVREAVGRAADFRSLVVLGAEVDLSTRPFRIARPAIAWDVLKGRPVGLALRIGRFHGWGGGTGRFADEPETVRLLAGLAGDLAREARSHKLDLLEIQLDYDCPESKLADYPVLVEAVGRAVAPTPVTLTALPSWLRNERAFKKLARNADGFVLQVHFLRSRAGRMRRSSWWARGKPCAPSSRRPKPASRSAWPSQPIPMARCSTSAERSLASPPRVARPSATRKSGRAPRPSPGLSRPGPEAAPKRWKASSGTACPRPTTRATGPGRLCAPSWPDACRAPRCAPRSASPSLSCTRSTSSTPAKMTSRSRPLFTSDGIRIL